jgi:peptidyl-tRNA hydrolase
MVERKEYYHKKNTNKKNKKLSIQKRKKSEEEIIDEVKTKGKYDEWVKSGRYFGLTSDTLDAEFFLVRPYTYYNVDGNIVNVSMIQKMYRPDVDNIAVFSQHYVKDPTHVDQSKYRFVDKSETLSTNGLATCSGLAMIIGTKKFMTHLGALTCIQPIIEAIRQMITSEQIETESLRPIIYKGNINSSLTLQKAKEICSIVGIPERNYEIINVCFLERVQI